MIIFYWILFTLACVAVSDVWFHGSIFTKFREAVRAKLDAHLLEAVQKYHESTAEAIDATGTVVTNVKPGWPHNFVNRMPVLLLELLSCPFCASYHLPWVLGMLFAAPAFVLNSFGFHTFAGVIFSPIFLLATTYSINKVRDLWQDNPSK